jgi:NAD(P)-dependent dehydrogenase (short-subunit alcohol dehydrogenase family)
MATELDEKHVVITGATGGLGIAVVHALLRRGATCHLPLLESLAAHDVPWINHEQVRIATDVDLSHSAAVEAFYGALPPLWASVHLAGGFAMMPATETSLADLQRMFTLNVQTCFLCCREAIKRMREQGQGGRIVNVSARPALQPTGGMLAYTMSKAAVASMTSALAVEFGHEDILVNAIVPSIIDTPQNRAAMPGADYQTWPKPEELAETIAFLVSPQNRLTSGALIPVYGRS